MLADANLDVAVKECILGSLSFNGQRCTALKIIFVHKSISEPFLKKLVEDVDKLKVRVPFNMIYWLSNDLQMGLPWEEGVSITPLPEAEKPRYLQELIEDAVEKGIKRVQRGLFYLHYFSGAKVINPRGNQRDRTFVAPTLLFPVNSTMRVYREEQFGPVVPIAEFESENDIYQVSSYKVCTLLVYLYLHV